MKGIGASVLAAVAVIAAQGLTTHESLVSSNTATGSEVPVYHVSFTNTESDIPKIPTTNTPTTNSTTSASPSTSTPMATPNRTPSNSDGSNFPNSTTFKPSTNLTNSTSTNTTGRTIQCPFVFTSALVTTEFNAVIEDINKAKNSTNNTSNDGVISNPSNVPRPTSSNSTLTPTPTDDSNTNKTNSSTFVPATTEPTGPTATPGSTRTTTTSPTTTFRSPTTSPTGVKTLTPTSTPKPTKTPTTTLDDTRRRLAAANDVAFSCDSTFYGKWITSKLQCGGKDLDVSAAVARAACATYKGDVPLSGVVISSCLTTCYFPSCIDGAWDYSADKSKPGFGSSIYANFDFTQWFSSSMNEKLKSRTENIVNFKNFSMSVSDTCTKESDCTCPVYQTPSLNPRDPKNDIAARIEEVKKQQARASDFAPQSNWEPKTQVESMASYTATVTQYATYVGVATSATAVAVTSLASTSVVSSAGAAASATGSAASLGVAVGLLDMTSFVTCLGQLNIERLPPPISKVASSVSTFQFNFVQWPSAQYVSPTTVSSGKRSLATSSNNTMSGMERYAATIGIMPSMLFYVTLVGLSIASGVIGIALVLILIGGKIFSKDFSTFQIQMTDRAVGACFLLAIIGQYAVGVTGTFEITRSIDNGHPFGLSVFIAIGALLFLSVGTIIYGYIVVRDHEEDIIDIGTKDHFDKKVHRRYGCLYDEYNYENRFFFVVKMLLALLAGMTTGMAKLSGLAQICIMIGLHVTFVLYLEVRQPHMAKFVQSATTMINVMKIASLILTAFLLSAVIVLPESARTVVGYVILSLQGLVVLFLVVRQGFIFYRQWKLKQEDHESISVTEFYGNHSTSTDAIVKVDEANFDRGSARRLPPLNHPGKEYTF